jgi:hypothetical protein
MAAVTRPRQVRFRAPPWPRWTAESAGAFAACLAVSVVANWRLLRPDVLSADALVHLYWMWHVRDPQLFNDPLTLELRHSGRYPDGYQAVVWLASHVFDPIAFGEWIGIALMALSGWLVFRVVREHTPWRPAAWIGAGLFMALIEVHRFYGGFPRAFIQPVVLLTVLLALRGHRLAAALCAAGGALFYPPAAALAVGVLFVSAVRRGPSLDLQRVGLAALALGLTAAAVLLPELAAGGAPRVMTAAEARMFPEFGDHGPLHFFVPSTLEYLRQNRSGFDLRTSGSVLAVAALALLVLRPANLRLLRAEVLAMPIVALGAYAVSQAVLFKLYLPHRYTYPLLPFFAIAAAVSLQPTWKAVVTRPWLRLRAFAFVAAPLAVCALAVYAFPLAPSRPRIEPGDARAIALAIGTIPLAAAVAVRDWRRPALGAAVTGLTLIAVVLLSSDRGLPSGNACPKRPVSRYLASLPKDAIIAGDPRDLMCIPATARRAVVISTQLAPAYEAAYFRAARARMFADLRAYYGSSAAAIGDLRARYGATHLLVKTDALRKELAPKGVRWPGGELPYGRFVRQLVGAGEPAALHLPLACRTWARGPVEVYDIGCVASR